MTVCKKNIAVVHGRKAFAFHEAYIFNTLPKFSIKWDINSKKGFQQLTAFVGEFFYVCFVIFLSVLIFHFQMLFIASSKFMLWANEPVWISKLLEKSLYMYLEIWKYFNFLTKNTCKWNVFGHFRMAIFTSLLGLNFYSKVSNFLLGMQILRNDYLESKNMIVQELSVQTK